MPQPPRGMIRAESEPARSEEALAGDGASASHPGRWLLFVHQLPSTPSNLRVRTWRRLQQLGAMPLKQAVYVLPDTPVGREDLEWLRTEVQAAGGEASVFAANHVDVWSDDGLVEQFRRSRQDAYAALARDVERALKGASRRRPRDTRSGATRQLSEALRERMASIERIDFFGAAGRDRVVMLLTRLEALGADAKGPAVTSGALGALDARDYHNRLWITRPRPGVDRMASAWLIRRFIDAQARFAFAPDRLAVPEHGLPFDMSGVEFSHHGDGCTFETLCAVFAVAHPAIARLAAIVHELDLKDGRFGAPEAATVGTLIEGLQLAHADDGRLLEYGIALFEALYQSFERLTRAPRARARMRRRPTAGALSRDRKR